MRPMKFEVDARSLNTMHAAMGAIVKSLVATLPPAQQKVFLLKLHDCAESAEATNDDLLMELLLGLVEVGQSEQRPPRSDA